MVRVGIIGATGYGGRELARLLVAHPQAELVKAGATVVFQPGSDSVFNHEKMFFRVGEMGPNECRCCERYRRYILRVLMH